MSGSQNKDVPNPDLRKTNITRALSIKRLNLDRPTTSVSDNNDKLDKDANVKHNVTLSPATSSLSTNLVQGGAQQQSLGARVKDYVLKKISPSNKTFSPTVPAELRLKTSEQIYRANSISKEKSEVEKVNFGK